MIFFLIFVGVVGRLIPHLPDMTPLTNLSLFAGAKFRRSHALITTFLSLFISDLFLSYFFHFSLWGYWSFFTYSGFLGITLLGKYLGKYPKNFFTLGFVLMSSFGFWLWTNFGVWLEGQLYPETLSGLGSCYMAALPFLRNAILGDLLWMGVIFGIVNVALVSEAKSLISS
jgi:hypothetical protein